MSQRIFCIGDIHGHYVQLMDLMDKLYNDKKLDLNKDILVTLGDNIDGGPDSKKVLDWSIDLKEKFPENFISIFGNHESLLLDALNPKHPIYGDYYLWWNQGGQATLKSFQDQFLMPPEATNYNRSLLQPKDLITSDYLDFIRHSPLFYETDDYFFVHGGLYPERSIEEHKEAIGLFHPDLMRGGDMAYDMIWLRGHIGNLYEWEKKLIFGHTVSNDFNPRVYNNMIGLDTMAHNHGRLTAVILPNEEFIYSIFSD